MKDNKFAVSFLTIGKTQESTETASRFKKYVGVGSTFIKGVQPTKKELDEFFGYESQGEPEYVVDTENGKEVRINFLLQTDPEQCNGIEMKSRAMIVLRNVPDYNRNQTKVRIIDQYGNYVWANVKDAKAGKVLLNGNDNPARIDTKYHMACVGECDLVDFLKTYLCVDNVFNYVNGTWVKKDNPQQYAFALEHIKDYFSGNFSELKEAISLQPNNKVKLLYGVRTTDNNKQYQMVCTNGQMVLRNSAGINALSKLEKDLANAKQSGVFQNIIYKVQELQEYTVEPTNLENPSDLPFAESSTNPVEIPWD